MPNKKIYEENKEYYDSISRNNSQNSYQSMVSTPVEDKWYKGSQPTTVEALARIYKIGQTDSEKGRQLYDQLMQFQQDKSSPFYNPYTGVTSNAAYELFQLGYDTGNGITQDFLKNNSYLMNYYRTGTSGTPLAPTKKSSKEEKAAYWYYHALKDEETTQKAEQEWAALQQEIRYWTSRQDRNYSDDEVLSKIDMSKYKTLASMDASIGDKNNGVPVSLNRVIGYNKDYLKGVVWAARNNGGTGNAMVDAIRAQMGEGNQYAVNQQARDLTANNPYAQASTMDEEAKYFNMYGFSDEWIEKYAAEIMEKGSEEDKKHLQSVLKANETTKKAEAELKDLTDKLAYYTQRTDKNMSDEEIMAKIDMKDYPTLQKMTEGMTKGELVKLTRGVNWTDLSTLQSNIRNVIMQGKGYEDNPELRAKLTRSSGVYFPYSVTSTVDDAAMYFNVAGFTDEWFEENKGILDGNDATAIKFYNKAYKANETTKKAEAEAKALVDEMNDYLSTTYNVDKALKKFNAAIKSAKYETLAKLVDSTKSENISAGKSLVELTRPINFDPYNLEQQIRDICEAKRQYAYDNLGFDSTMDALGGEKVGNADPVRQAKNDAFTEAAAEMMDEATDSEQKVLETYNLEYPQYIEHMTQAILNGDANPAALTEEVYGETEKYTVDHYYGVYSTKQDYSQTIAARDAVAKAYDEEIAKLEKEREEWAASLQKDIEEHPEQFDRYIDEREASHYADLLQTMDRMAQGLDVPRKLEEEVRSQIYLYGGGVAGEKKAREYFQEHSSMYDTEEAKRAYVANNDRLNELDQKIKETKQAKAEANSAYNKKIREMKPAYESALEEEKLIEHGWKVASTLMGLNGATQEEMDALNTQILKAMNQSYQENSHDTLQGAQKWVQQAKGTDEEQAAKDNLWFVERRDKYEGIAESEKYNTYAESANVDNIRTNVMKDRVRGQDAPSKILLKDENGNYVLSQDDVFVARHGVGLSTTLNADIEMEKIRDMTDDQLLMYGYLRDNVSKEAASEYYQYIEYGLNEQYSEKLQKGISEANWGTGEAVAASLATVPLTLIEGAGYGSIAYQNIRNWLGDYAPVDYNVPTMMFSRAKNMTRSKVQELVDWQVKGFEKDTDLFDFMYGGVMSGLDSVVAGLTGSWGGALILGASSATSTMDDLRAKGGNDTQVLLGGFLSGVFESLFEKISLSELFDDNEILKLGGWDNLVAQVFKEAGVNFSEEFNTEVANMIAGAVIMGDKDEYRKKFDKYKEEYGLAEAIKRISMEATDQALQAGASGAFMGVFFGAGKGIQQYGAANALKYEAYTPKNRRSTNTDVKDSAEYKQAQAAENGDFGESAIAQGQQKLAELNAAAEQADTPAQISKRIYALEAALQEPDMTKKSAALASALSVESMPNDTAVAVAMELQHELGADEAIFLVSDLVTYAAQNNIDQGVVRDMLSQAALGKGVTASALLAVQQQGVNAETFGWLRSASEVDSANPQTKQNVIDGVRENRVSTRTTEIYATMVEDKNSDVKKAEASVEAAQGEADRAQNNLEAKQNAWIAAQKKAQDIKAQFFDNPADENTTRAAIAANEAAVRAEHDYMQTAVPGMEKAQANLDKAQQDLKDAKKATMNKAREQAQAEIAAQDQQRAAEAEQRIAEAAKAAAAQAEQQAIDDERSGKTEERNVDSLAQAIADKYHLTGEKAEALINRIKERYEQVASGSVDLSQSATSDEAYKTLNRFARKLGVDIEFGNLPVAKGVYENGKIILSDKLTLGQAMVEAALHEITHAVEGTNAYKKYSDLVLGMKYDSPESLAAAVATKIADYAKYGETLDETKAKRELVAEFARTDLHSKDVVDRLVADGFGAKIKNALHNVNQFIKNFQLSGDERIAAENLRKAERLFQKALNQAKQNEVHPASAQFSIPQMAQAMGLYFDEESLQLYDAPGGNVIEHVTPQMVEVTPVGMLIDLATTGLPNKKGKVRFAPTISQETAAAQKKMFADLMSMCAKYKDSNLVWEIAASTLESTFSALKSNSDPQYKTTIDFGTVCAKTQEIINVLSRTMLEKSRQTGNGGLTREDIMKVYNETFKAGLTVPCPVCYVFSRWMGVPSLLGQMQQYQKNYVVTDSSGNIDVKATQEKADAYIQNAQSKYGNAKEINKTKEKIINKLKTAEDQRVKLEAQVQESTKSNDKTKANEAQDKLAVVLKTMVDLDNQLGEVEAYNWITQALCKEENGKYVVDPAFELTPDDILFDLNRTGEFAKYEKNWRYRNTRGAGMGKAILPYTGESLGDIIHGTKRWSADQNPFYNMTPGKAATAVKNAINRARAQNLVGGQRLQSTSDYRPEWGLDYMMSFLELQAIGSKAQMYTKVAEAVDFLCSAGGDVNLSAMPRNKGWYVDENGRKVLEFSDVTGMDIETAKLLKDKYDNAQIILVGINDDHIRLAMADSDIDFIIPWHSSGNSKDTLQTLVSSVGEVLEESTDYTDFQTDTVKENRTQKQKNLWEARVKMLMGQDLSFQEREMIFKDKYLKPLYDRFYGKNADGTPIDPECYGVKLSKEQAQQIFPYEYWVTDPSQPGGTKATADENGRRFVEYCESMGLTPRFSQFKDDPGYWKLLIDRSMYDNQGNYRAQQTVDITNIQIGEMVDGKLTNSQLPMETSAKYGKKYSAEEDLAVERSLAAIDPKYNIEGSFSVTDGLTDADVDQMIAEQIAEEINSSYPSSEIKASAMHSEEQLKQIAEYLGAVDDRVLEAAKKVKADQTAKIGRIPLQKVTTREVNDIKAKTGADVTGYTHEIDKDFLVHLEQRHGQGGEADSKLQDLNDVARIGWVMENYDNIIWDGGTSWEHRDKNNKQMPVIRYEKKLDSTVIVVEAVGENGRKTLRPVTARIVKNNPVNNSQGTADQQVSHAGSNDSYPNPTSVNAHASSANDIVAQGAEGVNPQYAIGGDLTDADIDQLLAENGFKDYFTKYLGGTPKTQTQQSGTPEQPAPQPQTALRQFGSQRAQASDALHEETKQYLAEHSEYYKDTNAAQIDRAVDWVMSHANANDKTGYYGAAREVTSPDFNWNSADGQARMYAVMGMAAMRGDTGTEIQIASAFNEQGTEIARALQARKMFRLMTPAGRQGILLQEMDKINKRYEQKGSQTRVKLSEETLEAAGKAKTEEDFAKVKKQAEQELAAQMPATWKEKLRGWRMLSMLGNPRTHIRNILGNAIFMPTVALKNKIGAIGEIVSGQKERTKTLGLASPEARAFAKQDVKAMKDVITGEAKYNDQNGVERERKTFGTGNGWISKTLGQGLQKLSDFNSNLLEKEDWLFLQRHYRNSLAGYMTANNLTAADMTGKTLDNARAYAIQEAQKATYRDASKIASILSNVSRQGGVAGFVVDAALPFKKTPANILKRGIEYSPVGLLKSLTVDAYHLKQYSDAVKNGTTIPSKAISPTQFIDKLASGLSGTAVAAVGYMLASMGVVTVEPDELEELEGKQSYSVTVNLFGEEVNYTVDWAAPVCMPFFVGAALHDAITEEHPTWTAGEVADSLLGISEPVFNLSMLDGVNSLFKTSSYGEGNALTQVGEKIASNYLTSYVPTAVGQLSRTIDTTRRKNYVESGADLATWRYALEQVENKTPWSVNNIPYRNAWGEEDTSSTLGALLENFLSPGYGSTIKRDAVTDEVRRVYEETKETGVVPTLPGKFFSAGGETLRLNAEQYDQLTVGRNAEAHDLLQDLFNTSEYQAAPDSTKAALQKDVWDYVSQMAKYDITPDYKTDSWVAEVNGSKNKAKAIIDRRQEKEQQAYVDGYKEALLKAIDEENIEAIDVSMEAMREAGKKDSGIKQSVSSKYRDNYKKAVRNGDWETAYEIETKLLLTGLYSQKDFNTWQKDANKE